MLFANDRGCRAQRDAPAYTAKKPTTSPPGPAPDAPTSADPGPDNRLAPKRLDRTTAPATPVATTTTSATAAPTPSTPNDSSTNQDDDDGDYLIAVKPRRATQQTHWVWPSKHATVVGCGHTCKGQLATTACPAMRSLAATALEIEPRTPGSSHGERGVITAVSVGEAPTWSTAAASPAPAEQRVGAQLRQVITGKRFGRR